MAEQNLPQPAKKKQACIAFNSHRGVVLLDEPYPCPACGCDHYLFVNRNGRTLCCWCDEARQKGTRP